MALFANIRSQSFALGLILACAATSAWAQQQNCPSGVDSTASMPLTPATSQANCTTQMADGYPIPDPACTPGAVNPTVTRAILQGGEFRTRCERDTATAAHEKATTYAAYNIAHPANNTGRNQVCELDHLISLEIGGADTLDNIWPQCGPDGVELDQRYFKIKDNVENYLAAEVRAGDISLACAQHGIAANWPQYIDDAKAYRDDGRETKYNC